MWASRPTRGRRAGGHGLAPYEGPRPTKKHLKNRGGWGIIGLCKNMTRQGNITMKKLTALILALALALSLGACKGKTTGKTSSTGSDLSKEAVEKMLAEDK